MLIDKLASLPHMVNSINKNLITISDLHSAYIVKITKVLKLVRRSNRDKKNSWVK
jgi:hypothetical protein